jgi:hypothetical protein
MMVKCILFGVLVWMACFNLYILIYPVPNPVELKYEANVKKGPDVICDCCGRLLFPHQTRHYTKHKLRELGAESEFIEDVFNVQDDFEIENLYSSCYNDIKKKRRPKLCMLKGFKLPELPEAFKSLNRVEERLVAARHVFQSIKKTSDVDSQYRTEGTVVNVPVAVDTTVSVLPRVMDDTNIIDVQLTRRMQDRHNYMAGVVNPSKVWRAAYYLKNTPLYHRHNITISDTWLDDQHDVDSLDKTENRMMSDSQPEAVTSAGVSSNDDVEEEEEEEEAKVVNPGGTETLFGKKRNLM